jgi:hypothetical protein
LGEELLGGTSTAGPRVSLLNLGENLSSISATVWFAVSRSFIRSFCISTPISLTGSLFFLSKDMSGVLACTWLVFGLRDIGYPRGFSGSGGRSVASNISVLWLFLSARESLDCQRTAFTLLMLVLPKKLSRTRSSELFGEPVSGPFRSNALAESRARLGGGERGERGEVGDSGGSPDSLLSRL